MNNRTIQLGREQLLNLLLDLDNAESSCASAQAELAAAEAHLEKCMQATTGETLDKEYSATVTAIIQLRQGMAEAVRSLQLAAAEATKYREANERFVIRNSELIEEKFRLVDELRDAKVDRDRAREKLSEIIRRRKRK